jgi:hypothetical protein
MKRIKSLSPGLIFISLCFYFQNLKIFSQVNKPLIYRGMCDASAAVALDENTFVVANDEDNNLRIYRKNNPDELQTIKLSEVFKDKIFDGNNLEIDMEGAAWINNKIFWIGSHSTGKNGKLRLARHRLFALQIVPDRNGKFTATAVSGIYTELIFDIEKDSRFIDFKLTEAMKIKPKEAGGLNIEGLAATPEGHLLIGFRNPLQSGKALIVELINPLEVIEGKKVKFASPMTVDLGGLGIRSFEYDKAQKQYLIIAGSYLDNNDFPSTNRLYLWSGNRGEKPRLQENVNLTDFNAEAAFFYPKDKAGIVQLFSDDGKAICNNNFRSLSQKF